MSHRDDDITRLRCSIARFAAQGATHERNLSLGRLRRELARTIARAAGDDAEHAGLSTYADRLAAGITALQLYVRDTPDRADRAAALSVLRDFRDMLARHLQSAAADRMAAR